MPFDDLTAPALYMPGDNTKGPTTTLTGLSCNAPALFMPNDGECDDCEKFLKALDTKQDKLTAGENIQISDTNVISATDTKYTAGDNVQISDTNVISATDTKYTAGDNVQISDTNVISATDTKYSAGDGIQISSSNVISAQRNPGNTYTKAEVDAIIAALQTLRMVEVPSLPATGEDNVIYLVPKTGGGYEMYVWATDHFVDVGKDMIDLSDYVRRADSVASITRSGTTFTAKNSSGTTLFTFDQQDNNTWKPNTNAQEGYVSSGAGQANKVWKTDGSGVPAWRDDANTTYSITEYGSTPNTLADFVSATAKGTLVSNFKFLDANNVLGLGSDWVKGWIRYQNPYGGQYTVGGIGIVSKQDKVLYKVVIDGGPTSNFSTTVTPLDTNTWKQNTASSDGYVLSGSGQANKVWKTDGSGNPAWRNDADTLTGYAIQGGTIAANASRTVPTGARIIFVNVPLQTSNGPQINFTIPYRSEAGGVRYISGYYYSDKYYGSVAIIVDGYTVSLDTSNSGWTRIVDNGTVRTGAAAVQSINVHYQM